MRYGFVVDGWDVRTIGDLTEEAENAGWDGLFISDAIAISAEGFPDIDFFDPWVGLAVMATRSERLRIGTIITPMPRRRPWKLARETLSIDHLSKGRLILGVGLGAAEHDGGFFKVGEPMDIKVRAERLDEGLSILTGLWTGKPITFSGKHYRVDEMSMQPAVVQSPRIPIWVPGVWQKPKSMERALKWDGIIPQKYKSMSRMTAAEIKKLREYVDKHREQTSHFDIIAGGETSGTNHKQAAKKVSPYIRAGATWWLESKWTFSADEVRARIKQGPPRVE
jgi:alkanesulfonate monooxygenase SsuD/methylene tetrahydromethanopterin reductase-like flavin-dependent oxidoreductase (luciferase family)